MFVLLYLDRKTRLIVYNIGRVRNTRKMSRKDDIKSDHREQLPVILYDSVNRKRYIKGRFLGKVSRLEMFINSSVNWWMGLSGAGQLGEFSSLTVKR